ncbi:hypothetical protein E6O75_ATG09289 [Venturia nashicola]|uniref:Uncharacterized protein n=1 Tax=Venturia nashicola TaxID=86259 RepID=A0A4Z1NTB4_9PEZI|nr:hypothetical protein E6O75_ATG09289 [Venturia nashicola]
MTVGGTLDANPPNMCRDRPSCHGMATLEPYETMILLCQGLHAPNGKRHTDYGVLNDGCGRGMRVRPGREIIGVASDHGRMPDGDQLGGLFALFALFAPNSGDSGNSVVVESVSAKVSITVITNSRRWHHSHHSGQERVDRPQHLDSCLPSASPDGLMLAECFTRTHACRGLHSDSSHACRGLHSDSSMLVG